MTQSMVDGMRSGESFVTQGTDGLMIVGSPYCGHGPISEYVGFRGWCVVGANLSIDCGVS